MRSGRFRRVRGLRGMALAKRSTDHVFLQFGIARGLTQCNLYKAFGGPGAEHMQAFQSIWGPGGSVAILAQAVVAQGTFGPQANTSRTELDVLTYSLMPPKRRVKAKATAKASDGARRCRSRTAAPVRKVVEERLKRACDKLCNDPAGVIALAALASNPRVRPALLSGLRKGLTNEPKLVQEVLDFDLTADEYFQVDDMVRNTSLALQGKGKGNGKGKDKGKALARASEAALDAFGQPFLALPPQLTAGTLHYLALGERLAVAALSQDAAKTVTRSIVWQPLRLGPHDLRSLVHLVEHREWSMAKSAGLACKTLKPFRGLFRVTELHIELMNPTQWHEEMSSDSSDGEYRAPCWRVPAQKAMLFVTSHFTRLKALSLSNIDEVNFRNLLIAYSWDLFQTWPVRHAYSLMPSPAPRYGYVRVHIQVRWMTSSEARNQHSEIDERENARRAGIRDSACHLSEAEKLFLYECPFMNKAADEDKFVVSPSYGDVDFRIAGRTVRREYKKRLANLASSELSEPVVSDDGSVEQGPEQAGVHRLGLVEAPRPEPSPAAARTKRPAAAQAAKVLKRPARR